MSTPENVRFREGAAARCTAKNHAENIQEAGEEGQS